jgi:hypothetical protein
MFPMPEKWAEKAKLTPKGNLHRALMRGELFKLSTLFQDTSNPAALWLCWHLAQKWHVTAPQPVTDAINRFAEQIGILAIQALDGNARTVINGDVAADLWDTSPKGAKDDSRRGATGLAEQLRLWERDFSLAFRIHELRKGGLTEDEAVEKAIEEANAINEDEDKNAKCKTDKNKNAKSKKAKNKMARIQRLRNGEDKEQKVFGFDNAKRIGRKYQKAILAAAEEVEEELNDWIRKKNDG